jgi:hypothetical protein
MPSGHGGAVTGAPLTFPRKKVLGDCELPTIVISAGYHFRRFERAPATSAPASSACFKQISRNLCPVPTARLTAGHVPNTWAAISRRRGQKSTAIDNHARSTVLASHNQTR